MAEPGRGPWRLGEVIFDPADGSLWRDGRRVPLTPKTIAILEVLVAAAPRTVTREQLLARVWPDTVVAEAALTQRVKELRRHLGDDARAPRFLETVARRGYRLVVPVLPLGEADALPPGPEPAPVTPFGPSPAPRSRPLWRLGIAVSAVIGLGGLGLWLAMRPAPAPPAPPAPVPSPFEPRPGVAVLAVDDASLGAGTRWIGTAVTEMLVVELGAGGTLRTIGSAELARGLRELGLGRPPSDWEEQGRLCSLLAADLLVTGGCRPSRTGVPQEIELELEVRNAKSGAVLGSVRETGPIADLAGLAGRAGARLRQAAGAPPLPPTEATKVRRSHPDGIDATRRYAEGLERMRVFEFAAAVSAFEEALALEPDSVAIRTALAHALAWSGEKGRAREELGRALKGAGRLPRELQLELEADACEMAGEWARAVEIDRSLHVLFPDRLDYGLSLATLLASHGQEGEAAAVLSDLRRLPGPLGQDPRIDLADAWGHEADLTGKLAAASRAAERARELGARLLLASARIQQGRAYRGLGKPAEALAAFEEAWRLREAAGEISGVGRALRHVAAVERDRGQLEAAAGHLRSAMEIAARLGEIDQQVAAQRALAALALDRGAVGAASRHIGAGRAASGGRSIPEESSWLELEAARLALVVGPPAEAVAAARTAVERCAGEKLAGAEACARALLARAFLASGELEAALAESEAAASLVTATDDRGIRLEVATVAAEVAAARSQCTSAEAALERSLAEAAQTAVGLRFEARLALGECARVRGDQAGAREQWDDVAREAEQLGLRPLADRARTALRGLSPARSRHMANDAGYSSR